MSKKGGYKIVSLGGLDLLDENLSLKGLYDALKVSYGKPILLTGIVIDGELKKDALVQANEGANKIAIKNLYGYDLEIAKSGDAITVAPSPDGIELPVPEPEDNGKVVKVDAEGKYVLGDDASGMANPMTSANDLIVGGTNGAPSRLAVGTEGQILKVGSSGLEWGNPSGGGTQLYLYEIDTTVDEVRYLISFIACNNNITPANYNKITVTKFRREYQGYMELPFKGVNTVSVYGIDKLCFYAFSINSSDSTIQNYQSVTISDLSAVATITAL